MQLSEFKRMRRELKVMTERLRLAADKVEAEFAGVTFAGTSDGDVVTAEADLRARIVEIRIAPRGLTRSRGDELGRHIVDAVARAKERARAEYQRAFQSHVPEPVR